MKKIIIIVLVIALMLSLSACGGKIVLEKDQSSIEINDKEVIFTIVYSEKDFEADFEIDTDQKVSRIEDDFNEFLEDDGSDEFMELKSIKVKNNLVTIIIIVDDIDEMDIEMGDFEDLIDDRGYKDAEEFAEDYPFVSFKSENEVDSDDMDKYEDYKYMEVDSITQKGTYFTLPGKILIVDEELEYEYVSSNIIFIDGDSSYGWVIYK